MNPLQGHNGIETFRAPNGELLALIIRHTFRGEKYNFPTPPDFALQLGINFYETGETIKAHRHLPRPRVFEQTQEFITISEGQVRLHLYGHEDKPLHSLVLDTGDSVLLVAGGHGFDVIQACKITEIKLGPYDETKDKVRL